jgi:serine/threonine protein kinase
MLEAFGKMNEKLVAGYVIQVLEGLDYLHHNDIVHGNLKAANILITQSGGVKLSDIGISLNLLALEHVRKGVPRMPNWDAGISLITRAFKGAHKGISCTPNWSAPEVINLKGTYTKSDIWSLGCTIIELLTGKPPYGNIVDTMTGANLFLCPVRILSVAKINLVL